MASSRSPIRQSTHLVQLIKSIGQRDMSQETDDDLFIPSLSMEGNHTWPVFETTCADGSINSIAVAATSLTKTYDTNQILDYVGRQADRNCVRQKLARRHIYVDGKPGLQSWFIYKGSGQSYRYDMLIDAPILSEPNGFLSFNFVQVFTDWNAGCIKLINGVDLNMGVEVVASSTRGRTCQGNQCTRRFVAGPHLWFNDDSRGNYPRWMEKYYFRYSYDLSNLDVLRDYRFERCENGVEFQYGPTIAHGCLVEGDKLCCSKIPTHILKEKLTCIHKVIISIASCLSFALLVSVVSSISSQPTRVGRTTRKEVNAHKTKHVAKISRVVHSKVGSLTPRDAAVSAADPSGDFRVPVVTLSGNQTWPVYEITCADNSTHSFAVAAMDMQSAYNITSIRERVSELASQGCTPQTNTTQKLSRRYSFPGPLPGLQSWFIYLPPTKGYRYDMQVLPPTGYDTQNTQLISFNFVQVFSDFNAGCKKLVNGVDLNMGIERIVSLITDINCVGTTSLTCTRGFLAESYFWFNDDSRGNYPRWSEKYFMQFTTPFDGPSKDVISDYHFRFCNDGAVYQYGPTIKYGCLVENSQLCHGALFQ
eukprot:jgi/Hompol1/3980/HPOL_003429-RA